MFQVKTFKDYVNLYVKGASKDDGLPPPKIVHEIVNPRWEICITVSDSGFQQSSFVNSIATTKVSPTSIFLPFFNLIFNFYIFLPFLVGGVGKNQVKSLFVFFSLALCLVFIFYFVYFQNNFC